MTGRGDVSSDYHEGPASAALSLRCRSVPARHPSLFRDPPPMPKMKQSRPARPAAISGSQPTICDKADVLFRSAAECCRQHRRYARLIEIGTDEVEQRAALQLVAASDEHLAEAAAAYESSCMTVNGERRDEWWHKANNLWHACREYARRHSLSDRASGEFRAHDVTKLASLGVEYELEASALLAMQHAVDAYRKLRPEADLSATAARN